MGEMILQVNHLSKSFGTHEVLRDIDLNVVLSEREVFDIIAVRIVSIFEDILFSEYGTIFVIVCCPNCIDLETTCVSDICK